MRRRHGRNQGFTLIELSIVLVIIGLIVGGVLVGQEMINAAAVRATVAQIEKYNTAVNTFRNKYNAMPGDIPDPSASNFGFQARGPYGGEGDGNGILEGNYGNVLYYNRGTYLGTGETVVFWVDLSVANMVDGVFITGSSIAPPLGGVSPSVYLPLAKLGQNNYIYPWSYNAVNYFGLANFPGNSPLNGGAPYTTPVLTVRQAYDVDKKIDDGFPQTGNVTAQLVNSALNYASGSWAAGTVVVGGGTAGANPGSSATGSLTTCFDNGGGTGRMQYSMEISNGTGLNCALSFQMQGAAR